MHPALEPFAALACWIGGGLAFVFAMRALVLRLQKKKAEKRRMFSPLSPTLQWMNTAGSILLALNGGDFRLMGGIFNPRWEHDEKLLASIRKMLLEYWGIHGHEGAVREMRKLVKGGMRAWYGEEMRRLESLYSGCSEEELIAAAQKTDPKADEDSFIPKMLMAYRRYGENALLGWDAGRAAYIVQNCYYAGYVSMEEVLDIGVDAGKLAQAAFTCWEEMMESYLLGGQYWLRENAGAPDSSTAKRWKIYEALLNGDKPYKKIPYAAVAFDTPLSKEVITDRFGFMPEYSEYYAAKNVQQ